VEKARGGEGVARWEALRAPEVGRRRTGSKTFQVPASALPSILSRLRCLRSPEVRRRLTGSEPFQVLVGA
jgi:hypothetical protein